MNKKQKKQLMRVGLGIVLVFLLMVLVVPLANVAPAALGETPTALQSFHKFFVDTKQWFTDNLWLIFLLVVLSFGGYYFLGKK